MLLQLVGLGLAGGMICLLFKQTRPELVLPTSLAVGAIMLWVVLGELSPAVAQLQGWLEQTGAGEYAGMLLKSLGICYLAQLAADSCRDAGQSAIASKIILGARVAVLLLALPLFEEILTLCLGLMGGET